METRADAYHAGRPITLRLKTILLLEKERRWDAQLQSYTS
jgi:hypothetical protein